MSLKKGNSIFLTKYIKNVKRLQWIVILVVAIAFVLFSHTVISNNKENLKKVALAEVQESMKETVNNIVIYVDGVNTRIYQQAEVQLIDLQNRILDDGIKSTEDLYTYLNVSAENQRS